MSLRPNRPIGPHRRPYRTCDGYIAVLPYNATHWRDVFRAAGREEWAQDEALGSDAARAATIDVLYERLAACLVQTTSRTPPLNSGAP